MIRTYRDLTVWQKAIDLAVHSYCLAKRLPPWERYGLAAQIQRSASAIPANVAEGHDRETRGDYRRGVSIARGSLAELETHIELAVRLAYLSKQDLEKIESSMKEVGRMLSGLLRSLQGNRKPSPEPKT